MKKNLGKYEYLALETKMVLHQFCHLLERNDNNLTCGVYLYDEGENRLWNGATPNIPVHFNEYTNGMSTINDIQNGEDTPIYVKGSVVVGDIERGEDITTLNHKRYMLKSGFKSYTLLPINYQGQPIGHSAMFFNHKRVFTEKEIKIFSIYNRIIEEKLIGINDYLISTYKTSK
jgi:GAF domain-containing protein